MATPGSYADRAHLIERRPITLTIAAGATESDEAELGTHVPATLECPAGLTATSFAFEQRRAADGTWSRLYRDGGDLTVTVAAGKTVVLDPRDFLGVVRLRLVGNAAQAASPATLVLMTAQY